MITFADASSENIPLSRLEEFVSEGLNPENRKHVTRAVVHSPSEFLRGGVILVDTPGIGSLATSGARESYAYLPRCDLGVLLVDAGSIPGRDEIDLLRLLFESGIPPMLVVSKADLLSEEDRTRMKSYIESEVVKRLATTLPVQFVSTVGKDVELAHSWFHREIEPLIARSGELAAASARRKLASLTEAVTATLRSELDHAARADPPGPGESVEKIEPLALRAEAVIAEASAGFRKLADRCRTLAEPTIQSASAEIVRRSDADRRNSASLVMERAISDTIAEVRSEASMALIHARDDLRSLVREMGTAVGRTTSDTEGISVDLLSLPSMSVPPAIEELQVSERSWIFEPRARSIERRISAAVEHPLTAAYTSFGHAILRAGERALSMLAERFAAESEPYRAQARRGGAAPGGRDRSVVEADLQKLLSRSPTTPAADRRDRVGRSE